MVINHSIAFKIVSATSVINQKWWNKEHFFRITSITMTPSERTTCKISTEWGMVEKHKIYFEVVQ